MSSRGIILSPILEGSEALVWDSSSEDFAVEQDKGIIQQFIRDFFQKKRRGFTLEDAKARIKDVDFKEDWGLDGTVTLDFRDDGAYLVFYTFDYTAGIQEEMLDDYETEEYHGVPCGYEVKVKLSGHEYL